MVISWFEKHNAVSWAITIFGAIAIFYISSMSFSAVIRTTNLFAILYHFSAFFCLALFLQISSLKENFAKSKKSQNSHEEHFENSFEKARNRNYSNFSIEKLAKSKKISKRSSKRRNKNYSNFSKGKNKYTIFILTIILAFVYGMLDELHQFFVPGRACTLFDVGIDGLGILFASMIYLIRIEYKSRRI
ncbi:MAG: VanZ family protein [Nanoarchaeota archaeon]